MPTIGENFPTCKSHVQELKESSEQLQLFAALCWFCLNKLGLDTCEKTIGCLTEETREYSIIDCECLKFRRKIRARAKFALRELEGKRRGESADLRVSRDVCISLDLLFFAEPRNYQGNVEQFSVTTESNNVIAIASLSEWRKNPAPVFQPITRKTKANRTIYA